PRSGPGFPFRNLFQTGKFLVFSQLPFSERYVLIPDLLLYLVVPNRFRPGQNRASFPKWYFRFTSAVFSGVIEVLAIKNLLPNTNPPGVLLAGAALAPKPTSGDHAGFVTGWTSSRIALSACEEIDPHQGFD